jgi:serine protease Do
VFAPSKGEKGTNKMNKKTFYTACGLCIMGVALVALPGSSAKRQEAQQNPRSAAQLQEKIHELQSQSGALAKQQEVLTAQLEDQFQDCDQFVTEGPSTLPGEEDLQVVTSNGGGWLGVGVSEITTEKAKELKLPAERGALLGKVVADSPAAKAGLKQNDVVTEINGQRIEGTAQFRRMIHEIPAGRAAQLTVWREGRSQNISVTVGKSDARAMMSMHAATPGSFAFVMPDVQELPEIREIPDLPEVRQFSAFASAQPRLGIDAENLEGDFGNYFGAPDGEGVLIRNVFENTPAAKAGLKAGDVITGVNGERVRTIGELREKLIAGKDTKSLKLGLLRNKAELTVNVEVPPAPRHQERHLSQRTNI